MPIDWIVSHGSSAVTSELNANAAVVIKKVEFRITLVLESLAVGGSLVWPTKKCSYRILPGKHTCLEVGEWGSVELDLWRENEKRGCVGALLFRMGRLSVGVRERLCLRRPRRKRFSTSCGRRKRRPYKFTNQPRRLAPTFNAFIGTG